MAAPHPGWTALAAQPISLRKRMDRTGLATARSRNPRYGTSGIETGPCVRPVAGCNAREVLPDRWPADCASRARSCPPPEDDVSARRLHRARSTLRPDRVDRTACPPHTTLAGPRARPAGRPTIDRCVELLVSTRQHTVAHHYRDRTGCGRWRGRGFRFLAQAARPTVRGSLSSVPHFQTIGRAAPVGR